MDAVTLCAAKPKAVFADNLLSDMAGLDGSALQASIATNDQPGTNYVLENYNSCNSIS